MRLAFSHGSVYGPPPMPFPILQGYSRRPRQISLGDGPTFGQEAGAVIVGAQQGASTALLLGGSTKADIVGGIQAGLFAAAPFTGPAAPVIAAIASIMGPIASLFKGCGVTCTQATQYADAAAQGFEQVSNLYWSQPVRTRAMQSAALSSIKAVMQQMYSACSNPQLGAAGQRCIQERLTPTGTSPGCVNTYRAPVPGGHPGWAAGSPCNAYTYYINPITNDPGVQADSVVATDAVTGQTTLNVAGAKLPMPLVLAGAGLLLLMVMK